MNEVNVGKNIREKRKKMGYNLKEFGELLGVSDVSAGRYETGAVEVTINKLYEIAKVLNTTVPELLELESTSNPDIIPVLSTVLGDPWDEINLQETITVDPALRADFGVRVTEDGLFKVGDIVLLSKKLFKNDIVAIHNAYNVEVVQESSDGNYYITGKNVYNSAFFKEPLGCYVGLIRSEYRYR